MTSDNGVVRSVSWHDVCAWTLLFRVFRLSTSVPLLLLALGGALATSAGWRLISNGSWEGDSVPDERVRAFVDVARSWPGELPTARGVSGSLPQLVPAAPTAPPDLSIDDQPTSPPDAASVEQAEVVDPADLSLLPESRPPPAVAPARSAALRLYSHLPCYLLVEPFRRLFQPDLSWGEFFFYLVGGLWTLCVWALFGGAIARIAAVRLGRDERVGLRESMTFARRKWPSLAAAPLMPLLAIAFLALPLWVLGLIMWVANLGVVLAGVSWGLVALLGLLMALFGVGLLFCWPLMWSTIASEGSDAFDAVSRAFAYVFQRPVHYLAYAALSFVLGLLGWIVVALFCESVILFTEWGISWGAGVQRLREIQAAWASHGDEAATLLWLGGGLIHFFNACIRSVLTAFSYSYFWAAAAGVYLLLRRDTDQTEIDDVFLEEEGQATYGLPSLPPDEAGVPGVEDEDVDDQATSSAAADDSPPTEPPS